MQWVKGSSYAARYGTILLGVELLNERRLWTAPPTLIADSYVDLISALPASYSDILCC